MVKLGRELDPSLVIMPSTRDTHQDHQVISNEGFRAFKKTSLIGYEVPQNNLTFPTNMFVKLSEDQLRKKINASGCYESQRDKFYFGEEIIRSLAMVRGMQAGCPYAEAFEVMRWVL